MKKINIFASLLLLLFTFTACKKALDINDDPNYITDKDASAKFLLPSGIVFSASRVGGDYHLLGSLWSQHYTQNNNSSQYRTYVNYNITNNTLGTAWNAMWAGALKDLKLAMDKSSGAAQWNYYIAAEVMSAFDYHILNDFYGAIPLTEAFKYDTNPHPHFDDSRVVNAKIIAMLDDAISKKAAAATLTPMGNEDFLFHGDIDNWIRFAKSLKLKILMRDFVANQVAIQTLLTENDLLTADAKLDVFIDAENKSNPLYEQDRRKLNTPGNLRASAPLLKYLQVNNDPRIPAFFETTTTTDPWPAYYALEYGDYNTAGTTLPNSKSSRAVVAATDAVYFMSGAEVAFLKAEAYARLGNAASAKANYDAGVTAAFDRWGFDAAPFIAPAGKYEFNLAATTDQMIEQIITQKWVAAARSQGWDAFFDQNRTGYPQVSAVETTNAAYVPGRLTVSVTSFIGLERPRRLLFPKVSSDYNPNTPTVVPITTKMWWHK